MDIHDSLKQYIKDLNDVLSVNDGTELSYRPALASLLTSIMPNDVIAIMEPKHEEYGVPDFKIYKHKNCVISFIETKPIGDSDLEGNGVHSEQFDRYKNALSTIVFTDYFRFLLYVDGEEKEEAKIVVRKNGKVALTSDEHEISKFEHIVQALADAKPQKITSPSKLSKIMAAKAKLLADIVRKAIKNTDDKQNYVDEDHDLVDKMYAFKDILVHDMDVDQFADFYAQTIVYGIFIARYSDDNPETFSRLKAAELIPKGYGFLKEIFSIIAISNIHSKLKWVVDDLAELFKATDMKKVLMDYGNNSGRRDPVVHFYEDFLEDYNPDIKEQFGVWLTPLPVVDYIVNAVDYLLKNVFNLEYGLADKTMVGNHHKVEILDPAIGTGTFHAEIINKIKLYFAGNEGMWPEYVREHLVPRLMGFEYLMAPYTMAHLKVATALGIDKMGDQAPGRLNIFLTNSLDKYEYIVLPPFARQISLEASAANKIKENGRVMVVMGNPPYHEKSANNGDWIMALMDDYKQEPGKQQQKETYSYRKVKGIRKINTLEGERNSKALNNDYCKFIRLGQMFVEGNEEGILAYITANTYLDTKLFRGMRYNLLQAFDKIYVLNLHGNARHNKDDNGIKDENVFDIETGVAIAIYVKLHDHHDEGHLAKVYYKDVYGTRKEKFSFLNQYGINNSGFEEITPTAPLYVMRKRETSLEEVYNSGFAIDQLMSKKTQGMTSGHDNISIFYQKESLSQFCDALLKYPVKEFCERYNLQGKEWLANRLKTDIEHTRWQSKVMKICYRPFDDRWIVYDNIFIDRYRKLILSSMAFRQNTILSIGQQGNAIGNVEWSLCFISDKPVDKNIFRRGGGYLFPLYTYDKKSKVTLNLSLPIVNGIENATGLHFKENAVEGHEDGGISPIDIIDYVYAVLNSTKYHTVYHDFLQTAFPIIPYPKDAEYFKKMVASGRKLRLLHTMKKVPQGNVNVKFPIAGDNIITRHEVEEQDNEKLRVWINKTQYFDNVPKPAWNLTLASYNVADNWLAARKRDSYKLSNPDIIHFKNMIAALNETINVKKEIDKTIILS